MPRLKKLAVVLFTLNEKSSLKNFIPKVFEQEKHLPGWQIDVVISDSQSTDGTEEFVKDLMKKNPHLHFLSVGFGIGVGIVEGHRYALKHLNPDLLAQIDADGQVEEDVLVRLVKAYEQGYNLVLGSRFVEGGKNNLSLSRRIYTVGASYFFRLIIGPLDIKEITNSARAFTPELFRKINLRRVPWRERSFIIQPAFLHEAIEAGAKYTEVPLVFKNRAEGYSKNKVANYVYDFVAYGIEVRLRKLGINVPVFHLSRRLRTFLKFGMVGVTGTLVDFVIYNIAISSFGLPPATSRMISVPGAIMNNFLLNNFWTFKSRKNNNSFWKKLFLFYAVSFGGVAIAVLSTKLLDTVYGHGVVNIFGMDISYYNIYFFATILPVLLWNFTVNHFITWKKQTN